MHPKRIHLFSVGSTNRHLSEILRAKDSTEEIVLVADYQENGLGQGDHHWHSKPGENLLMSLLLFPAFLSASSQFHLTRVASVALCDMIKDLKLNPMIKWPNDILIRGKKVAGILIENGILGQNLAHSILGIGLNVNQREFPDFPVPATSLMLEGGGRKDLRELEDRLLEAIGVRYHQLESGSVTLLEEEYLANLYNLNQPANYITRGKQFNGIIRGVNDFGELLVDREGVISSYGFQEIGYSVSSA